MGHFWGERQRTGLALHADVLCTGTCDHNAILAPSLTSHPWVAVTRNISCCSVRWDCHSRRGNSTLTFSCSSWWTIPASSSCPHLHRMQVSAWPGGQGVLGQRGSLVQCLCQVSDVVRRQNQNIQLGQLGVRWDWGQSRLRTEEGAFKSVDGDVQQSLIEGKQLGLALE